ncbi:alpha/beta fold hydrolase [Streptomyces spectabilis]|uniref:Alpha/beta fold hydrolase n=1 Tax=Streptomyces spectabilis TaxID=68270 RepID=A0A5P2XG53_STRST|nr:alpha/beta hydrolase [Streptomyces spectabilis]MBB5104711.1 pimeloyl-ACP methyl ester carboxylesterase [Streptomyces spectabilis]MCI3904936.1 alpha/beta hydrolase [Streptomyces spectabilis]QEV61970.1 alpha/beta fold hydrolase [Streptomyces spectabilis]GGV01732.1 alpha/beta hydrolase [Streptomyces spectabilis]
MSRPPTFSPPPGTRARVLETARGAFAVLDAAPARPTGEAGEVSEVKGVALLLPGFTGSKEDFIALLRPLAAAGYRAVAVDGRGQYESAGPDDESAYALGELARDALAQADALDGPAAGPPHLVGHSLGGLIARRAALLAPTGTFASLTLMSSGPGRIAPSQRTRATLLTDALATHSMAAVWEAMRAMDPPEDAEVDGGADNGALRARWLRNNPAQLIATGKQLCVEPDRVAELAALELPVHVLSGEHDDTWPVPLLDDMARRLGAHRTVVTGADHSPNTDRPEATAAALVSFWDGTR